MAKSIKFTNDIYLDSSGVVYKENTLDKLFEYSTEEQVIGKWIDGKPLYRKTFKLTDGNTYFVASSSYNFNDLNVDYCIIKDEGITYIEQNNQYRGRKPFYNSDIDKILFFIRENSVQFRFGSQVLSRGTFQYITFTLEYTKTTD